MFDGHCRIRIIAVDAVIVVGTEGNHHVNTAANRPRVYRLDGDRDRAVARGKRRAARERHVIGPRLRGAGHRVIGGQRLARVAAAVECEVAVRSRRLRCRGGVGKD